MRGFGLLIAMDAIDRALQEQAEAARRRPTHKPSPTGPDGEPADGLDPANRAVRMSAWRAWAHRRELADEAPAIGRVSRRGEADGAAAGG